MSESLWQNCLETLQSELPSQQYNMWVRPLQVQAINIEAEVDQSKVASLQTQLASSKTQNLYAAVIESLKAQADIEIY